MENSWRDEYPVFYCLVEVRIGLRAKVKTSPEVLNHVLVPVEVRTDLEGLVFVTASPGEEVPRMMLRREEVFPSCSSVLTEERT